MIEPLALASARGRVLAARLGRVRLRARDLPVLAVGGWADPYRNAVLDLVENLAGPRFGLIGPWAHGYPHDTAPGPQIAFLGRVRALLRPLPARRRERLRRTSRSCAPTSRTTTGPRATTRSAAAAGPPCGPGLRLRRTASRSATARSWPSRRACRADDRIDPGERPGGRQLVPLRRAEPAARPAPGRRALALLRHAAAQRGRRDAGLPGAAAARRGRSGRGVRRRAALRRRADGRVAARDARHPQPDPPRRATTPSSRSRPARRSRSCCGSTAAGHRFAPGHRIRLALSPTYFPWMWPSPRARDADASRGASSRCRCSASTRPPTSAWPRRSSRSRWSGS